MNNVVTGLGIIFMCIGLILVFWYVRVEVPTGRMWRGSMQTEIIYVFAYRFWGIILLLIGLPTTLIGYYLNKEEKIGVRSMKH